MEGEANGRHTYRWEWKQLDPTVGPEAEALKKAKNLEPLSPAQQLDATEGALPDIAWTTFPSWETVGAWYRGLEGDRAMPDEAIRAKVAEITAGTTGQEEKVRAVYAWVSGQIRYIGVALGIGRYQPHTASTVLENQYGDCKDKHTLLAAMLTALGLQPDAVLVGPGIRFNRDVPSPASFNHLITRVSVDGKEVWLDSTTEVADYRVLLAAVRDKDVLVVPRSAPATIAHTPPDLPFRPASTFAVTGSLDGSLASDSSITITHHDDMEVILRAALRQTSPAEYEAGMQALLETYGFGGKVSHVEIEHISDPSLPLMMRFHYHRDRSEDWGENRITVIFGPTLLPVVDKKDLPRVPLELGLPRTDSSTLEMKLPPGWVVELPEAIHQHAAYADCDVTYRVAAGSFFAERRITVLQEKVPLAAMNAYADWYEACGAGSVPYLQLNKASTKAGSAGTSSPTQSEARRLVNQADIDIRAGRYDQAETNLKKAEGLDPYAQELWGDFAAVAMHRGDGPKAMELYAKEIDLHPESAFAYRNLASLQSINGDNSGAADTLQRLQKRLPANPAPAIQAVQMSLNQHDNAEALKHAKAFEALLSEDARTQESFRLVKGEAEMRGGEIDAGEALIVSIARDSTDPGRRNDASYELAVAGRDLPLAEQTERAVLNQLTAESRAWTGGEAQTLLLQKSSLTTAAWDTMGWILFKEEKAAEAEAWIRAALAMRANAEVGEHLGDILMAEKKPSDAALAYAEALASLPSNDGLKIPIKIDPLRVKELKTKLEAAKSDAKVTETPEGRAGLQAMRTWNIGAASGLKGTAEFQVLLSSSGVVSAQPIGEVPHSMQQRIEAAKWSDRFPPGEDTRVAKKVMLNCHAKVCELVIEP